MEKNGENLPASSSSVVKLESVQVMDSGETVKGEFRLSKQRWAVLAGISIFGFLNGIANDLNSILSVPVELTGLSLREFVYIQQAFNYIIPLVALPTARLIDRYGLKAAIYASLLLASIRNISRILFFLPELKYWTQFRLIYWISYGLPQIQIVVIYYCIPLKVSENWFGREERSIAWSTLISTPMLGSAVACLALPNFIASPEMVRPLAYLNLVCLILSALVLLIGVRQSKPENAPSARSLKSAQSDSESQTIWESIKRLLLNRNVLIQTLTLTSFDSLTQTINSVMQDVLTSSGLSPVFCGQFLAITIFTSVGLQLLSSFMLPNEKEEEKKKSPAAATSSSLGKPGEEDVDGIVRRCKIYVALQWLTFLLYAAALSMRSLPDHQWWLVIFCSLAYIVSRFWAAPNYTNLLAHIISGSISEARMGALGAITQSILVTIYTFGFMQLRRLIELDQLDDAQSSSTMSLIPDYQYSLLFAALASTPFVILYLTCFRVPKPQSSQLSATQSSAWSSSSSCSSSSSSFSATGCNLAISSSASNCVSPQSAQGGKAKRPNCS